MIRNDSNLKNNIYNKKRIKNKLNYFHNKKKSKRTTEYTVRQNFIKKYITMPLNYNVYITNNIIFNDKSHLVSEFKEYLVIDDKGEFLKRYYNVEESLIRIPKFCKFYFLYSKVFPNYTPLSENKFLYNNIYQKQRMIDLREKIEKQKKMDKYIEIDIYSDDDQQNKVFSTEIINSLLNATNREGMEMLFDVKKDNSNEEENNFTKGVNQILEKINNCQNNKKNVGNKKEFFVSLNSIFSDMNKNNRIKNAIYKALKSNNKENISQLSNLKNTKIKTINNINTNTNKNIIKNKIKELKNNEIIIRNKLNINNYNEKSKNKNNNKNINEKALVEKLEKELFKLRKRIKNNRNYISQNISLSIQSKKDLSLSKKNISVFNNNNNNKNPSSSVSNINIFNAANCPPARGRSTKISSSNSFIKDIKKNSLQKFSKLQGSNELIVHKKIQSKINNNKIMISRNKKLQTSSTASNLFHNMIKYINEKYIDSRNKKNISINTNTKIDIMSYKYRNKISMKKKIFTNNTNNIKNYNFNNSKKNLYDFETQNNKEFDLNSKIKNIKKFLVVNYMNKTAFNKNVMDKSCKTNKNLKIKNIKSSRNMYINSYKKLNANFKEKKSLKNNKFCYSSRNIGRNDKNKKKLVFNFSQSKLNISNRTKYKSKDNSKI